MKPAFRSRFPFPLRLLSLALCLVALLVSCRGNGGMETQESDTGGEPAGSGPSPASQSSLSQYLTEVMKLDDRYMVPAVADSLAFGNEADGTSHSLTLGGRAEQTIRVAATGTRNESYPVVLFREKGDSASFVMNLSAPVPENASERIWFEVEEIHENTEQGFAYSVLVNGKIVYFRSYEQIASAPNHYFFSVARSEAGDLSAVALKFVSDQDAAFAVSKIRAYTDFSALAEDQEIYRKMGVYQYSANSAANATENLAPYRNYSYDLYEIGAMFRVDYLNTSVENAVASMETYLTVAQEWGIPVQIMNSIYWSSSPYGPDGKGGSFTDPIYTQVTYNSKTGEYYRSTPNVYSDTNWVTAGSDNLNEACADKLSAILGGYSDAIAKARMAGFDTSRMSYVMEWGVCYKAIDTMRGLSAYGKLDAGDFNPGLVEKAAIDGVTLDPTDGLSYAEKLWLTNWTARYNQTLADAWHRGFSSDPVIVNAGKIDLPAAQSLSRLFSHNVQWLNRNPSYDLRISGWKGGIGTGFYSSSEDMYFDDIRYYQYKNAYGRTGCVNLEMAIHNPSEVISRYLSQSYELGLEFVTLFNDKASYGTAGTLKSIDSIASKPATAPVEYRRNLINVDFLRDVAIRNLISQTSSIVACENMEQDTENGMLAMKQSGTGSVTFRVQDGGKAFANGLSLAVQASESYGDSIRIYVGSSPDQLNLYTTFTPTQQVDRFNKNYLCTYDLASLTKGLSDCYIRIECTSGNATAGIQFVKVYLNNSMKTGQADGSLPTVREARTMNLYVSARAVAEDLLAEYLKKNGSEDAVSDLARKLIARGYVATAAKILSGQISEVIPATYVVTETGRLGRYPVAVTPSRANLPVTVTLTRYGASGIDFTVATSKREQTAEFVFSDLPEGSGWTLVDHGGNSYSLVPGDAYTAQDGKITVTVQVLLPKAATYTALEGRAYADQTGISLRVTVQDRAVSHSAEYVSVTMDNGCQYTRRADDGSDVTTGNAALPKQGDYVKLRFNEAGTKVVSVESVYGKKTGVVRAFIAPDAKTGTNGTIIFEDGSSFDIEYQRFTTKITIGSVDAYARSLYPSQISSAIRPGMTLEITYCPERYNGANPRLLTVAQG